jgi:hypothetical protein
LPVRPVSTDEARDGITHFKQEFDAGMGDDSPLEQVTKALRSANPREP